MSERRNLRIVWFLNLILRRFGYAIQGYVPYGEAYGRKDLNSIWQSVEPFTMVGEQRLWSLMAAVEFIHRKGIAGDVVECGVWRGGAIMAAARVLLLHGSTERNIWLFDTFEGMTQPSKQEDKSILKQTGFERWARTATPGGGSKWCAASLEEVQRNIHSTGYPPDKLQFRKGSVENTLLDPRALPEQIAILRLDMDWYEPTLVALRALFPRVPNNGVVILDDYGHWHGAKKAVDEYFHEIGREYLLVPVDYTGRMFVRAE